MTLKNKRIILGILCLSFFIYTFFVYIDAAPGDKGGVLSEEAVRGKLIFQEYNCTACHQLYGLGGYMGPDLTNVISTPGKGEAYARASIQGGTQRMPNFHLNEPQVADLIAYLTQVSKTGNSPVTNYSINSDGSVQYGNE